MKTWWLFLIILTCLVGCAPGYNEHEPESIYQGGESENLYRNPETQGQYEMRIWQEESQR